MDVRLFLPCGRSLAQRDQHKAITCGMQYRNNWLFLLANRGRTLVGTPEWGEDTSRMGRAFDQAAIAPSRTWNGHIVRKRTAAIPGNQDRAGKIWRADRACTAPRHLDRTSEYATWRYQGASGLRQELTGSSFGGEVRAGRQLCRVA